MRYSVLISHFNKGKLLHRALDSLSLQIFDNVEVIVLDDCSSDKESIESFENAKCKYLNVIFLKNDFNRGMTFSKNRLVKEANGDVLIPLDADDFLPENAIRIITDEFEKDSGIDILFGNYKVNEEIIDCSCIAGRKNYLDPFKLARKWLLLGSSPIKKKIVVENGGYSLRYPKVDDIEFFKNAIVKGATVKYTPNVIYNWIKDERGINSSVMNKDHGMLYFRTLEFNLKYLSFPRFVYHGIKSFYLICQKK